ncbi:hypothetical protein KY325_01540 [Candidatus Woesearchaeota archaeon]|nr:hypothetical protein [Candidatus Woesearchaeota archaeon]
MDNDTSHREIPMIYNAHKMLTLDYVVARYPRLHKQRLLKDLLSLKFYPYLSVSIPDLEYSVYRRNNPSPVQSAVKIEFDLSIDNHGKFEYSVRNATLQDYAAPLVVTEFGLFFQIPDVSTWTLEQREEFKQKILERQARAQENMHQSGDCLLFIDPDNEDCDLFPGNEERDELMYDVIENLCDAPWSEASIIKARKFLDDEARLITGLPEKMGKAGDLMKRALTELMETPRFRMIDDEAEQRMITDFVKRSYEENQRLLYDRTFQWNRNNIFLVIKNNVYLNGTGEEVDWSRL